MEFGWMGHLFWHMYEDECINEGICGGGGGGVRSYCLVLVWSGAKYMCKYFVRP